MTANASFTEKLIEVSITLGKGNFGAQAGNTKVINGLRVECSIKQGGHPSKPGAQLKIYGMMENDMRSIARNPFAPLANRKDYIKVRAGDFNGLTTVFTGEISEAWANYHAPPNLYLHIAALAGYYPSLIPVAPSSKKGSVSVASLMKDYASQMGYTFEDNGVTAKIMNPYFHGSPYDQASQLADAVNIEFGIDNDVLFICPLGKPRGTKVPLISQETGMKESPVFDKKGLKVETLFNPMVVLGGLIEIKSQVPNATGTWRVHSVDHHLESENPSGQWITHIKAAHLLSTKSTDVGGEM